MPLPKGIYRSADTRNRWILERRATLDAFDRLTAKGLPLKKAARTLGVSLAGIRAMRASVEGLERGRATGHAKTKRVDLGLALLSVLRRPGEALTVRDIAAWCDCSPQSISGIEHRALAKVRARMAEMEMDAASV